MINNFLFPSETSQILPTSGKGFMNTCRILKYGELKFYEKGLENSDKTYKPIVLFPVYVPLLIDIKIIAIADPILIKSILKEEFREKNSLLNGEGFADAVKQLVGSNNVFTVNREIHEILRQLFYKPLMTDQIQQYQPLFKSLSIEFLDRWAAKKEKKEEISIFHEMQKFTLKAFLETLLGFSYNNPDDLSYSLNYFIKILGDLTLKKTDVQKLESDQKYQNCRTVIHQVIEAIFCKF